ncbi:MAG TPA: hypothetical protein VGS97_14815 [Actinocrinis sp.]|uniref:hypothetical protein n=1 Tax=Actinocrinis sp. TaxID=1920516 RepID=UPI002DDD2E8E|nr:hypothetical protein [Actinocrinis sp.]HEV2345369.1 hypothetical protein [Actinocrinis sp.]
MLDENSEPSEALVMDWNEHNDHADAADFDFDAAPEPDGTALALDALYALARESRAEQQADMLDALAEAHAEMVGLAEILAARGWADAFQNYGAAPPPLNWRGYADPRDPDQQRLVAHLGQGLFLAHRRATDPWNNPAHTDFTLIAPCLCAPNRYREEPVTGLWNLADALDKVIGRQPECTRTCRASLADNRRTRP